VARLYHLQISEHGRLSQIARRQYLKPYTYRVPRGNIYDRNLELLAGSTRQYEGKGQMREQRHYPEGKLAAQVIGFVGKDLQGLAGIEYIYDHLLRKKVSPFILLQDALGRRISLNPDGFVPASKPRDLVLTLDKTIQYIAERELERQVRRLGAKAGAAIIMDPFSGEILALAIYPSFDPNHYQDYPMRLWRNWVITDTYEPGSTFKVIVLAAALQESLVSFQERFFCENGKTKIGNVIFHDIHPYGWLSLADIIIHSSNIGSIKISQRLGKYRLYRYIKKFGFGSKTQIDLPGESPGMVRPLREWSKISLASISIGYEIGVTPIQILRAYCAIANGGYLIRPRITRYLMEYPNRRQSLLDGGSPPSILSQEVCRQIVSILIRGVEQGTGKEAYLPDYTVAGKTGTAQKFDRARNKYSHNKVIASFVGFTPAQHPRIAILVILDEPERESLGGKAAAPLFRRIARQVLTYLRVPPDKREKF